MLPDHQSPPDIDHDVEVLYNLLGKLPPKQRECVVLFELSGFSLEEIRQLQGGTLSGVKSRLTRGREQLRLWLLPSEGSNEGPRHQAQGSRLGNINSPGFQPGGEEERQ